MEINIKQISNEKLYYVQVRTDEDGLYIYDGTIAKMIGMTKELYQNEMKKYRVHRINNEEYFFVHRADVKEFFKSFLEPRIIMSVLSNVLLSKTH